MEEILNITNLEKSFGEQKVLKDINFSLNKGQVITLIGASGSGKSTLLRCLNLLEKADGGCINFEGTDILSNHNHAKVALQKMGMVFQSFNLFDNLSVLNNCTLAPKLVLKSDKEEISSLATSYLAKVGLLPYADVNVASLSGGQKQRVAIARALCMKPELILFDEPTSALDPESVSEVLDVIKDLADGGMSMVIVTHEMEFARDVSDVVCFMQDGEIVEANSPDIIFTNPEKEATRSFLNRYLSK